MEDSTYILYDTCKRLYPYSITEPSILTTERRLNAALDKAKSFPEEVQSLLFDLQDALDILAYEQAHHAFQLGLDLGLSMSREMGR